MNVTKHEIRVVVTVDSEGPFPPQFLDSNGFPWATVHWARNEVTLAALREDYPAKVTSIFDYEERLPIANRDRALNYMSFIEAHDISILSLLAHASTPIQSWWTAKDFRRDILSNPNEIRLEGAGFIWGPLPLSPLKAPLQGPFRGITKGAGRKVIIESVCDTLVDVVSVPLEKDLSKEDFIHEDETSLQPKGAMRLRMEWGDRALEFASHVADEGWEKAVRCHFPHGVRLGGSTPGG